MPDVTKIITLTALGSNAGPTFNVYYSIDGISYILCIDGSGVVLNSVGATISVTVPDTANYMKLVNLSGVCNDNEIINEFNTTTTTTTSTTTSTTTIAPCAIKAYTALQGTVTYVDPYNQTRTITHNSTSRFFLAKQIITSSYTPVALTRTPVSVPFEYCNDINLNDCSGSIYSVEPNQNVAYHYAYYVYDLYTL